MNFGEAIQAMKDGKRVARAGWNGGKGMWLFLADVPAVKVQPGTDAAAHLGCNINGTRQCIVMLDAQKMLVPGWLASQTDMLADDWEVAGG